MSGEDFIPQRNPAVQWREFGSDTILLDVDSGVYAQVNATGALIWERIDGQKTVSQIIDELRDLFGDESIDADTSYFIEELRRQGLLSAR
jgi:hypothetical protein